MLPCICVGRSLCAHVLASALRAFLWPLSSTAVSRAALHNPVQRICSVRAQMPTRLTHLELIVPLSPEAPTPVCILMNLCCPHVQVTWVAMIICILFFEMNLAMALWTGLIVGLAYTGFARAMYRTQLAAIQREVRRPLKGCVPLQGWSADGMMPCVLHAKYKWWHSSCRRRLVDLKSTLMVVFGALGCN